MFTQSIDTGILPGDWRRTNVTPIFKKGSKVSPENYRPISLTSQVVKVLEGLVRSKMMSFLDENEIITNCQHSFIKKKSCFTNLLTTLEDWTSAVDQGYGIDVAYLGHLTQYHIKDSFRSYLAMDLVVGYFVGLRDSSQIVISE